MFAYQTLLRSVPSTEHTGGESQSNWQAQCKSLRLFLYISSTAQSLVGQLAPARITPFSSWIVDPKKINRKQRLVRRGSEPQANST